MSGRNRKTKDSDFLLEGDWTIEFQEAKMAYLNDDPVWEEGVRQLEETDICEASTFNGPLGQLARRTRALKQQIAAGGTGTGAVSGPDGWGLASGGRNLLEVFGVATVAGAVEALHQKTNADGVPDFSGLRIGDYLDLPSLNDGSTTYTWNEAYKNLRVVISGFNTYKHMGSTENAKNHIVFTFENCPLSKRMNATNTNTGGYAASGMRTCLEGGFLAGLVEALGHDYLYSVRRYISGKGGCAGLNAKIFLLAEAEAHGTRINGDGPGDSATDCRQVNPVQLPIFRDSYKRRIKRCNGSRQWYFLSTPYSGSAASFCHVYGNGVATPATRLSLPHRELAPYRARLFHSRPLAGRESGVCNTGGRASGL
jgi:hypothetical protein